MIPLRPGDPGQVGRYQLLGRLGAGGMGEVFLGRSTGGRLVAVKLIRPEHADNGMFRTRFAREVEAAKQVGGFYTAMVLDADPDADPPWMATAYIPGPSLRDAVTRHGPLPLGEVRALGAGLAEGLAAIHARGLAHRDLKPANVIMASDGPRIIDFGLVRAVDSSTMTETGAVFGTYAYMSPEQVRGEPASPASDVFALGCVLTFAATGHGPFDAGSIATIVHRITSEQPNLREVPQDGGLLGLVSDCLTKNAAHRPTIPSLLAQLSDPSAGQQTLPPATERIAAASGYSDAPRAAGESGTTFPPADDEILPGPYDHGPTANSIGRAGRPRRAGDGAHGSSAGDSQRRIAGLDDAAAQLAMAVGAQWHAEQERRRIYDPFPLPVRWHLAAPRITDHWANIRRAPPGQSPGPLALKGRLERIADVYRRIPSGRLVVLGRAGSGKTIVAMRFVLDMLAARGSTDPAPVLFSVGGWNPAAASLRAWMIGQLEREYPALAAPGPGGSSMAAALVEAGRILPVLDGFDEIAADLRGAALRGLNATTMALLLTSRPEEYVAAVTTTDVVSAAACVELDDLSLADLTGYLPRTTRPDFPDGQANTVWDPVLAHLRDQPADPAAKTLLTVLSTPLMVSLARTAYSDAPGHNPADLLNAEKFGTPAAVADHLLDTFTPACYQEPLSSHPGRRNRQADSVGQAQHWLGCIAWHLDRLGTQDIAVWNLGAATRLTCGLVAATGGLLIFGLAGWVGGGGLAARSPYEHTYALIYALITGMVFGLAGGLSFGLGSRKEPSHAQLRFRGSAPAYLRRLVAGAAVGAAFALSVGLGLGGTLLCGLACGLALGSQVWLHRPTSIATVPNPRDVLNRDRAATLAFGLAVGLAFGTVGGLTVGYAGDPLLSIPSRGAQIAISALIGLTAGALLGGLSYGRVGAIAYALAVTATGALANGPLRVTGLGAGLAYGTTFGCGVAAVTILPRAWGVYTVDRILLALGGHLPWQFMAFLTDAHRRGVLRQSGGVYQFRHARVQRHLALAHQKHRVRARLLGYGWGWPAPGFPGAGPLGSGSVSCAGEDAG